MNDIFDGSTNDRRGLAIAVDLQGQTAFSQLQYNLFFNNNANIVSTTERRRLRGQRGGELRRSPVRRPGRRRPRRDRPELRAQVELAGDRRGPQRDRAARRRQRDLSGDRPAARERPGYRHPHRSGTLPFNEVPGKSDLFGEFGGFGLQRAVLRGLRLAADRHPAGLGLLQLPRRVAAGPDRAIPTATQGPSRTPRDVQLPADHGHARSPGPNPRPRPERPRRRLRQQPVHRHRCLSSTSTCTRPRSRR